MKLTRNDKIITSVNICATGSPTTININALWDTGAVGTFLNKKIITKLALTKTGEAPIGGAFNNTPVMANTYSLSLLLPNHSKAINITINEINIQKEYDMIIGMDIIKHGSFSFSNEYLFNFEILSLL